MGIQINGQTDTISAVDNNFSLAGNVSIGGTLTYEDVTSVDAVGLSTFQAGIQLDDSITHLGDTDTAIRFPANDTVTVETAGSEKVRVTSGGNVGINTIPTIYQFEVNGGIANTVASFESTDATSRILFKDNSGEAMVGAVGDALTFYTSTNANERLRITSDGKVGIGTDNPNRKLVISQANSTAYSGTDFDQDYHVLKLNNFTDSKTVGMQFLIGSNGEAAVTATETSDGATDLIFGTRGGGTRTEKLRITSDGKIGINEISPSAILEVKGAVSAGSGNNEDLQRWNIASDNVKAEIKYIDTAADRGMLFGTTTDHILSFQTNNTEKLRITSDGHLQIRREGVGNASGTDTRHTRYIVKQTNGQEAILGSVFAQGKSSWGGDLVFATKQANANPSTGLTETMRLNAAGHLKIPNQPRFSAYGGASQVSVGSAYKIEFNTANVNVGGSYSISNDRFTAPVAGDYYFMYRVMAGTTRYLRCQFRVNGSNVLDQFFSENVTYANNVGAMTYTLSAGDYVEVWCDVQNNSQGDLHGGYRSFVGNIIG